MENGKLKLILVFFMTFLIAFSNAVHAGEKKIKIITSFDILADIAKNIAGDKASIESIVPKGTDPHAYQPTASDAKKIADADIIIINGLGFEEWFAKLVKSSNFSGTIVTASDNITVLTGEPHEHGHGHGHIKHKHKAEPDPHAWQDPKNVIVYVANIEKALSKHNPEQQAFFKKNLKAYVKKLNNADLKIKKLFSALPSDRKKIITDHNSFRYFEKAYGIEFLSPYGINSQSEPSVKQLAQFINQIKKENIKVLFIDASANHKLLTQLAKDLDIQFGEPLYSDHLSETDAKAKTYIDLILNNADKIYRAIEIK
ncbi:MAG: zinc ABC transporter substrate-binding protein [Alphaproteobacteria bacterium]|nr:zinc ABC transporter substrate-binding protein [Alphaproteobacteria bacterium]